MLAQLLSDITTWWKPNPDGRVHLTMESLTAKREEEDKAQLSAYLIKNAPLAPYHHQIEGVYKLLTTPYLLLADEMGLGKTKQVIDAAQTMYMNGTIDRVIIACPSAVRSVWFDPILGEWAKHVWPDFPLQVAEFRNKVRIWKTTEDEERLKVVVTNYEFLRNEDNLAKMGKVVGPKTLLVVDESSYVKNHAAQQTKAIRILRKDCGRVVLLNGTPLTEGVGDLFSQAYIMNQNILSCRNKHHFDAIYAVKGGWQGRQILSWRNVDHLQEKMAPYVVRRLKEQCLDLPPKIPSVNIQVTLDPKTWKLYKDMENEFIAWLGTNEASVSTHAAVRAIRLQQITSGYLGGIAGQKIDANGELVEVESNVAVIQNVGNEKRLAVIEWFKDRLAEDPQFKCVIWARFTKEILDLIEAFRVALPNVEVGRIAGGQTEKERNHAIQLLDPRTAPKGPVAVVGNPASGGMGLTLVAASTVLYISNYWRLITRLQSEDRVHRPGQTRPVNYFDVIAVGPKGQRTIDFSIVKRLAAKNEVAQMTSAAWLSELGGNE